jgi:hypothetical protein
MDKEKGRHCRGNYQYYGLVSRPDPMLAGGKAKETLLDHLWKVF